MSGQRRPTRPRAPLWFTPLAIPRGAPHAENAHAFLNYLPQAHVMADITHAVGYAKGVPATLPLLDPAIAGDPVVYPPAAQMTRLFVVTENPPEVARDITRLWQKFKSGQ